MGCSSSSAVSCSFPPEADFHAKYQLGTKLGEGNFGQVRQATDVERATFAVKILHYVKKSGGFTLKETIQQFHEESALWQQANGHKNVVQYFEAFGTKDTHYIVMEVCKCSVLDGLKNQRLLMQDLSRVFREMTLGLAHCHSARVVHRDVKPDNFLLGGDSGKEIKLTDFGLAAVLPQKKNIFGVVGTAPYMSPELLGLDGYTEKTDVWSLGVTAYVMLFGVFPYMPKQRSSDAMKAIISKGYPCPSFKPAVQGLELPVDAIAFVKTLLNRDKARVSMHEVSKLDFVAPESPSASTTLEVASALKMAKALSTEFKERVDPTVQRSLDELLQRLQTQRNGASVEHSHSNAASSYSDAAPSWFSETPHQTSSFDDSNDVRSFATTVTRRKSRHSTHSGISLPIKDDSDDDTNESTRPPTPEETLPPFPRVVGVGKGRSAL